jgi:prepilin-type N-terminal cleavage/methylation domain-containing protein
VNNGKSRTRGPAEGFTLIEVVVSLTILALALAAILPIYSNTIQRQDLLANEDGAILLARSRLDSLGEEIPLVDGSTEGVADHGYGWRVDIIPYGSPAPGSLLTAKLVTVTIHWPAGNRQRSLAVKTIRVVGHD